MLTVLEKVEILQKVPLFRDVPTESLARIAAIAQEVALEPRKVLYKENAAADTMFVVLEGEISLVANGQERQKLGPHRVAGALALLASTPQPESAVALGDRSAGIPRRHGRRLQRHARYLACRHPPNERGKPGLTDWIGQPGPSALSSWLQLNRRGAKIALFVRRSDADHIVAFFKRAHVDRFRLLAGVLYKLRRTVEVNRFRNGPLADVHRHLVLINADNPAVPPHAPHFALFRGRLRYAHRNAQQQPGCRHQQSSPLHFLPPV